MLLPHVLGYAGEIFLSSASELIHLLLMQAIFSNVSTAQEESPFIPVRRHLHTAESPSPLDSILYDQMR